MELNWFLHLFLLQPKGVSKNPTKSIDWAICKKERRVYLP